MDYLMGDERKIDENQKTVAFLEVSWHHDVLTTAMEISRHFKKWEAIFIVSEGVLKKMGEVDSSNVIKIEDMYRRKWATFSSMKKLLDLPNLYFTLKAQGEKLVDILKSIEFDVLVINTLTEPAYFAPLFRWIKDSGRKLAVVLHNVHYWNLKWFIESLSLDEIKNRKFENLIFNILHRRYINGIITLGEYVLTPPQFENVPRLVIPSRLSSTSHSDLKTHEQVYFVIPGKAQEGKGKNYRRVIAAFEKVLSENPEYQDKVRLVLLGRLLSPEIKEYVEAHNLREKVILFESFVKEEVYQEWLNKAHFAIIPITLSTPYGKYKISGALNDAFSNGIPLLLPVNYAPHYNFPLNVIRFSWENLEEVIKHYISIAIKKDREYKNIVEKAEEWARTYAPSIIANEFESFLNDVHKRKY